MKFIIIQVIGAVAFTLLSISYYKKEKEKILFYQILAYIVFTIHYYMLGGLTGAMCNLLGLISLVIIYLFDKFKCNKDNKKLLIYSIIPFLIVISLITFENIYSLFPILASVIAIASFVSDNENKIRQMGIIVNFCWLVYAIVYKSYISIFFEIFTFIATVVAFMRNRGKGETKDMKKSIKNTILILIIIIGVFVIGLMIKKILNESNYNKRITEILADDVEIERKWLIDKEKIPYNLNDSNVEVYDIKQTYLCFDPEMRVRDYNNGAEYEFTIKTNMTSDGMVRDEVNFAINKEQYDNLVKKQEGVTIHKTRYQFYDKGQIIAIDIFHGDLDGLAYMEIEFKTKEESDKYKDPDWVIKDVTSDVNYKNGHLARYGIPSYN